MSNQMIKTLQLQLLLLQLYYKQQGGPFKLYIKISGIIAFADGEKKYPIINFMIEFLS